MEIRKGRQSLIVTAQNQSVRTNLVKEREILCVECAENKMKV